MKTIKNFIAFFAIILISFLMNISSSYARDDIDWSDLEMEYSYDYSSQKINIKVWVDQNFYPSDRYTGRFKFEGKTYTKDFSYYSSRNELYFEESIPLRYSELENDFEIDLRVINTTRNITEYDDTLYSRIQNYMDWNDVEINNNYNWSNQYLNVEVVLEDVERNPNSTHYSHLKINGSTHTSEFRYSSSEDKYYATHNIYINRNYLDDEYSYTLWIKNQNYSTIYEDSGYLEVDEENSSKSSSLNWSNMKVSNYYNSLQKELNIVFNLANVKKSPGKNYYVSFDFNGKTYTKKLTYLSYDEKLYASITLNVGTLKDSYNLNFQIDANNSLVYWRKNEKLIINKPTSSTSTSITSTKTPVVIKKYNTDSIAQKIINIAEERYTYSEDKIYYLERITNKLDNFFGSNAQDRVIVNGVNNKLKQQIQTYKQTQYYEEDLFDLDESYFYWR